MLLAPLIAPLLTFVLREVVIKFVVFTVMFALVAFFIPKVIAWINPFIGTSGLSSAFGGLGGGVWFFLEAFNLTFGLPLILSAYVARFMIRRLPVIG